MRWTVSQPDADPYLMLQGPIKLSELAFPEPPEGARDGDLWTLLTQFEFVRWMRPERPDEYQELVSKLPGFVSRSPGGSDD